MTNNQAVAYLEAMSDSPIAIELIRAQQKRNRLGIRSIRLGAVSVSWFKGFGMHNVSVKLNGCTLLKLAVKA